MSTRRVINIKDPTFSDVTLISFDPEPGSTSKYKYIVEKYKLDPVTGNPDKYKLSRGSSIRNYAVRDRKLTIKAAASFNDLNASTKTTQDMQRAILSSLPVGLKTRVEVLNTIDPQDVWWTDAYVDKIEIKEVYKSVICFQVDFLLPDVYFQSSIRESDVEFTVRDEDTYGVLSVSSDSDVSAEVTITWSGSYINEYGSLNIESWRTSGSQQTEQAILKTMRFPASYDAFVYKSKTGEFTAVNTTDPQAYNTSMWTYVRVMDRQIKIYPGDSQIIFRFEHAYGTPTSIPSIKVSYVEYKSDPISQFSN